MTVLTLSEAFANYLVPVLPRGPGVCEVCWQSVVGYDRCFACDQAADVYRDGRADVVVPIALATATDTRTGVNGQFAYELNAYKNHPHRATRELLSRRLAALLWRFLHEHEPCVAAAAKVDAFTLVTTVPSTSARSGVHPLADVVGKVVGATRDRFARCLTTPDPVVTGREMRVDRFGATRDLTGHRVLLIDDQWTTGSHAQSAAFALKRGGASRVAVVVLGRRFSPGYAGPNTACADYFTKAKERPFRWEVCCLER